MVHLKSTNGFEPDKRNKFVTEATTVAAEAAASAAEASHNSCVDQCLVAITMHYLYLFSTLAALSGIQLGRINKLYCISIYPQNQRLGLYMFLQLLQ